jgi:serine/threonine protein kinase
MAASRVVSLLKSSSDYAFGEILARVSSATIHEGTDRVTGERVAIKRFATLDSDNDRRLFLNGVAFPLMLNSPGLLVVRAILVDDGQPVGFVDKLCPNGSLGSAIRALQSREKTSIGATDLSNAIFGIAFTMSLVHATGTLHRGLNPDNILLDANNEPIVGCLATDEPAPIVGSPVFVAPELFAEDPSRIGLPIDVYAFAVSVYSIFAPPETLDDDPTPPSTARQFLTRVRAGARFAKVPEIPDAWWALVQSCWAPDPGSRPTFEAIVQQLKTNDDLVVPGTDLEKYHEYQARRLCESAGSRIDNDIRAAIARALGWDDLAQTVRQSMEI